MASGINCVVSVRILVFLVVLQVVAVAAAQAPPPGSPGATETIDGRYLPPPPDAFKGVINLNAIDSKAYWPARVVPPKGAPNVLLIMTDDVGFGAPSTFGGVIPTPSLDRVARQVCATRTFIAPLSARRPGQR
jgi:arylsulfatase